MLNLEVQNFVFTVENRTYLNSLFPHNSDQWSINTVPMNNVKTYFQFKVGNVHIVFKI